MFKLTHVPGDMIRGQYKVLNKIKAGGMGSVYRVEDVKIKAIYACKEMDLVPDSNDVLSREALLEAFVKEANAIANFRHPCVPRAMYIEDDADITNRRCYLLLDYIEGEDLEEKIKRNGRPFVEGELKGWLFDIADALFHLHSKGITHGDIKPDNILIENATGKAYLLDFGLATGGDCKPSGMMWGTKGYVPDNSVDGVHRDIYAFGMTIYRLLTNKNPKDRFENQLLKSRKPREVNSSISEGMERIIVKALSVGVYSSVGEMISQLKNLSEDTVKIQSYRSRILRVAFCGVSYRAIEKSLRIEFIKKYPDVKIEFISVPLDLFEEETMSRYEAGRGFDVIINVYEACICSSTQFMKECLDFVNLYEKM